jgi:hypothetical protein
MAMLLEKIDSLCVVSSSLLCFLLADFYLMCFGILIAY